MQGINPTREELSDLDLETVAAGKDNFPGPNSYDTITRGFSFSFAGFNFSRTRRTYIPGNGVGYGPGYGYRGWW
jgi:hypothetical protein